MKWLLIIAILFGAPYAARAAEESLGTKVKKVFEPSPTPTPQTPKEETDTNSVARDFAETKESFSESIANRDAQE